MTIVKNSVLFLNYYYFFLKIEKSFLTYKIKLTLITKK